MNVPAFGFMSKRTKSSYGRHRLMNGCTKMSFCVSESIQSVDGRQMSFRNESLA